MEMSKISKEGWYIGVKPDLRCMTTFDFNTVNITLYNFLSRYLRRDHLYFQV